MSQRLEWHKWYDDVRTTVESYRDNNIALAIENEQITQQNRQLENALRKVVITSCEKKLVESEDDLQQNENNTLIKLLTSTSPTHTENNNNHHTDNDTMSKTNHDIGDNENNDSDKNCSNNDDIDTWIERLLKEESGHKKASTLLDRYQNHNNLLQTVVEDKVIDVDNNYQHQNKRNGLLYQPNINSNDDKWINKSNQNNNETHHQKYRYTVEHIDLTDFSYGLEERNDFHSDDMSFGDDHISTNTSTLLSIATNTISLPPITQQYKSSLKLPPVPQQYKPSITLPPISQQHQSSITLLPVPLPPYISSSSSSSSASTSSEIIEFHETLFSQLIPTSLPISNTNPPQVNEQPNTNRNLRKRKKSINYKLPTLRSKLRKGDRYSFTF